MNHTGKGRVQDDSIFKLISEYGIIPAVKFDSEDVSMHIYICVCIDSYFRCIFRCEKTNPIRMALCFFLNEQVILYL